MTTATTEKKAPARKKPAKRAAASKASAKKAAPSKAAAPKERVRKCPACGDRHPESSFETITVTKHDKRKVCGFCADDFNGKAKGA